MRDKSIAAILALFAGGIGAHKFYLGRTGAGLMYLLFCWTMIPGFIAFFEFIGLMLMDQDEFNRRYNGRNMLMAPNVVNVLPPAAGGVPSWQQGQAGSVSPQAGTASSVDVEALGEQLRQLHELRVNGLLSDEEYQQQKQRLLQRM